MADLLEKRVYKNMSQTFTYFCQTKFLEKQHVTKNLHKNTEVFLGHSNRIMATAEVSNIHAGAQRLEGECQDLEAATKKMD